MKTAVWAAAFFIWANVFAAVAGEGEVLPPPVANLPWEHGETGLLMGAHGGSCRSIGGLT